MERGKVVVERVGGKSKVTRCFCKYPLKFIVPNKVGAAAAADAVWIYTITYGGGIVSGDSIAFDVTVGDGCTAVFTTQSSTKVYKSLGSKSSQQTLEVFFFGYICLSNATYIINYQMILLRFSRRASDKMHCW
ncbi:hypothetical protein ABFS82_11G109700 [Erythranthe guttata]